MLNTRRKKTHAEHWSKISINCYENTLTISFCNPIINTHNFNLVYTNFGIQTNVMTWSG